MSKKKTIKAKQKKSSQSADKNSVKNLSVPASKIPSEKIYNYILNGLFIAYLLFYIFRLYSSLADTFFWADENKHAYICSLIFKSHQIPQVLPEEIYGQFKWSYPPLFHILGALYIWILGLGALKFFNLMLLLIFLVSFYGLIRKFYGQLEAIAASLLITVAPILAINTVRFITEMLTILLIFYSFFFMVLALKNETKIFAILSGLATGLLMLAKQVGVVFLGFYGLVFIWYFFNNKNNARIMFYIIGVSVAIYIPYLVWFISHKIEVFNFVSAFWGLEKRPDWATAGVKSFRRFDSSIKEFAYLFYSGNGIVIAISFLLPLYHFIRTRLKDQPQNLVFILTIYLAAIMIIWHITNSRHIITLLPLMGFLFCYAFQQRIKKLNVKRAAILLLLIIAGYSAYKLPDYRQKFNSSGRDFQPLAEIIKETSTAGDRTLCINRFDVLMYTQKPVIWPHPKLRDIPIDLVEKQSAEKLYRVLKKYQIKYVLINLNLVQDTDIFFGRNYPMPFIRNCEKLDRQGKLSLTATSKSNKFILLKVI